MQSQLQSSMEHIDDDDDECKEEEEQQSPSQESLMDRFMFVSMDFGAKNKMVWVRREGGRGETWSCQFDSKGGRSRKVRRACALREKRRKGQCRDSEVKSCGLLCCDRVESPTKQKAGDAGLGGFQLLARRVADFSCGFTRGFPNDV